MKKILGILGLVLGAVAVYFGIIFAPEIKGAFLGNNTEPPTQDVEEPGEPTGDVVTDIVDSDLLKLTKRNKVSANGTALSVTATLSPENVNDKTVTWSIAWKTTNSANVNDYITLTPSADTLTCTVAVKKAFTTQIILTCTSKSNTSVKATCTIDYVGREYPDINVQANNSAYNLDTMTWRNFADSIESNLATSYNSVGGSLVGNIKNVKIDFDEFETSSGWCFYPNESDLIKNYSSGEYDYTRIIDTSESSALFLPVFYDLYYGNTLIESGLGGYITVNYTWTNKTVSATGLTLNDTQLIF